MTNWIQQGEEILVPTWEIASNPTIKLSEIMALRFKIIDTADKPKRIYLLKKLFGIGDKRER